MSNPKSSISRLKQAEAEATAANVASPKGIATKTTTSSSTSGLQQARRRLSVVSDNTLVEGMSHVTTTDNGITTASCTTHAITTYAGKSKKGYAPYNPRKKNQDSMIIVKDDNTSSLLLCVFDGHGEAGDGVSTYFKKTFPEALFAHASFILNEDAASEVRGIQTAIAESINACEVDLLADKSIDTDFSGTTAIISVTRGNTVIVANIGDSRITRGFMSASKIIAEALSDDHKPDRADEKKRILDKGGRVFAVEYDDGVDGPPRVWLGHMDVPGLAMSRSLGDTVAHTAGVISMPEFSVHTLTEDDEYLVLASDGLWEFMSDQEVLDIVAASASPTVAVDVLIDESSRRWMKEEQVIDDTTIIVATIR